MKKTLITCLVGITILFIYSCTCTQKVSDKKVTKQELLQNPEQTAPDKKAKTDGNKSMFADKKSFTVTEEDSIVHFIFQPDSLPQILIKVFPQVEFYFEKLALSHSSTNLMCRYYGENYFPLMSFNFLIDRMKYKDSITLYNKVQALLTLREGLFSKIRITSLTDCNQKIKSNIPSFNLKLETLINGKKRSFVLLTIHQRLHFMAIENEGEYSIFQLESLPLNYK